MRLGSLKLFHRTSSAKTFNLASWHSPHSLTWRWVVSLSLTGWHRSVRLGLYRYGTNGGPCCGLNLPFLSLRFSQQRPMWFKDMIRRSWDEEGELKSENRRLRREIGSIQHSVN